MKATALLGLIAFASVFSLLASPGQAIKLVEKQTDLRRDYHTYDNHEYK